MKTNLCTLKFRFYTSYVTIFCYKAIRFHIFNLIDFNLPFIFLSFISKLCNRCKFGFSSKEICLFKKMFQGCRIQQSRNRLYVTCILVQFFSFSLINIDILQWQEHVFGIKLYVILNEQIKLNPFSSLEKLQRSIPFLVELY